MPKPNTIKEVISELNREGYDFADEWDDVEDDQYSEDSEDENDE